MVSDVLSDGGVAHPGIAEVVVDPAIEIFNEIDDMRKAFVASQFEPLSFVYRCTGPPAADLLFKRPLSIDLSAGDPLDGDLERTYDASWTEGFNEVDSFVLPDKADAEIDPNQRSPAYGEVHTPLLDEGMRDVTNKLKKVNHFTHTPRRAG